MTIVGLLILAMIVMKLRPQTPLAQWLRHHLVALLLRMLSRVTRQKLIFFIIAPAIMMSFAEMGMPQLGLAAAIDVSMVMDALVTVVAVASMQRASGAWNAVIDHLPLVRRGAPRPRARRSAGRRVRRPAANDDDGHEGLRRAA
jgi:hypothetical protein